MAHSPSQDQKAIADVAKMFAYYLSVQSVPVGQVQIGPTPATNTQLAMLGTGDLVKLRKLIEEDLTKKIAAPAVKKAVLGIMDGTTNGPEALTMAENYREAAIGILSIKSRGGKEV